MITFKWRDPSNEIANIISKDKFDNIGQYLTGYVDKVVELFKEFVKNELVCQRTIEEIKKVAIKNSISISVRLVSLPYATLDSASTFQLENGVIWLETKDTLLGEHYQSYSLWKLMRVLNTFTHYEQNNITGATYKELIHSTDSIVPKASKEKNLILGQKVLDELDQAKRSLDDALIEIKALTGIKFKCDVTCVDFPILVEVIDRKDQPYTYALPFKLVGHLCNGLKTLFETKPKAKEFITKSCQTGKSSIRITNKDVYHENLLWGPKLMNHPSDCYMARLDGHDLVLIVGMQFNNIDSASTCFARSLASLS